MVVEEQDMEGYSFPSKTIYLADHITTEEAVKVDSCVYLKYSTKRVDPEKVLNDPSIKDNKELLWQMAAVNPFVGLFDATMWSLVDYKPLRDMIHTHIVCSAHMPESKDK